MYVDITVCSLISWAYSSNFRGRSHVQRRCACPNTETLVREITSDSLLTPPQSTNRGWQLRKVRNSHLAFNETFCFPRVPTITCMERDNDNFCNLLLYMYEELKYVHFSHSSSNALRTIFLKYFRESAYIFFTYRDFPRMPGCHVISSPWCSLPFPRTLFLLVVENRFMQHGKCTISSGDPVSISRVISHDR